MESSKYKFTLQILNYRFKNESSPNHCKLSHSVYSYVYWKQRCIGWRSWFVISSCLWMFYKKHVLKNFAKLTYLYLVKYLVNKVGGYLSATVLKKRFRHRCFFPVHFWKTLWTPILGVLRTSPRKILPCQISPRKIPLWKTLPYSFLKLFLMKKYFSS